MKTLALIPARGGSKGVPKKNIRPLSGYPLIAYSIAASLRCEGIERTIVSTDSEEIAEIARFYGAEVPFMRPSEFAHDRSPNIDFILHALDWLKKNEGTEPEYIVQVLPTTPLRDPRLMNQAIGAIRSNPAATSLRSVHELPEPPQKMMGISDGFLTGFFPDDPRPEYYNLPRQTFPPAFHPNGYVEIIRTSYARGGGGLFGPRVLAFITPVTVEIDLPEEFEYLEYYIEKKGHPVYDYLKRTFPSGFFPGPVREGK
jgi:CMP-N,N'-diacetyllegionaminic acid synthase